MSATFNQQRRQPFLGNAYYEASADALRRSVDLWMVDLPAEGDSEAHRRALAASLVADDRFALLSLHYTAGKTIAPLRIDLATVVEAYERYQSALGAYEGVPTMSSLGLDQLGDYERCMQLIGLCHLLHRRDLLPRIAAMIDPGYRGEDTLYEDLLGYALPDRVDLDAWYHGEPYSQLVQAMHEDDSASAAALLKRYCEDWYPAFKHVPWHDGHKRINGTEGDYCGYWAFEAGAVALLRKIDDATVDHLVYPRDLVAWAREHSALSDADAGSTFRLRAMAGEPCPREGWWMTPAKAGSRRRLCAGEAMPGFGSDYGATIWQWDEQQ